MAQKGKLVPDPEGKALILDLRNGTILKEDRQGDSTGQLAFETYVFRFDLPKPDASGAAASFEELPISEILTAAQDSRCGGGQGHSRGQGILSSGARVFLDTHHPEIYVSSRVPGACVRRVSSGSVEPGKEPTEQRVPGTGRDIRLLCAYSCHRANGSIRSCASMACLASAFGAVRDRCLVFFTLCRTRAVSQDIGRIEEPGVARALRFSENVIVSYDPWLRR